MESLSEETWDLVIAGTGLQQSLLALSLSRSDKKVLHVDRHAYYGSDDAGFSLQEATDWVEDVKQVGSHVFSDPAIQHEDQYSEKDIPRLAASRSYTVSLRPQIVYARSAFLPTLVSSQIHSQLEFLAVGSWWVLRNSEMHKIPSTREDVFNDDSLSMRDKRSLMRFLRFVLQDGGETLQEADDISKLTLQQTLDKYKVPKSLHSPILALALAPQSAAITTSDGAVARIRRHLQSVGYFGPGFGAVVAKYGGNAEISQVACRAQAVGGGIYLLGHGVRSIDTHNKIDPESDEFRLVHLTLSDGTAIKSKLVVGGVDDLPEGPTATPVDRESMLQSISIVANPLTALFPPTSDSGPVPAAAIVLVEQASQPNAPPIYLQVHSEDTGECPSGQCIIYASTQQQQESSPSILRDAVSNLLSSQQITGGGSSAAILWHLSYKTHAPLPDQPTEPTANIIRFAPRRFDIAVEDEILEPVRAVCERITAENSRETFLRFEERRQEAGDDN